MSAALQKANDPASAPTLPGHGSNRPGKGKEMNRTEDSTGQASAPAPKAKPSIADLESPINDARNMASILSRMLEQKFSAVKSDQTYYLTASEVDDLLFAGYHVETLISGVLVTWEAAV